MKVFRIAALGVALLAGSTAIAGAQNAAPPAPTQQGGPGGGRGGFNRTMTDLQELLRAWAHRVPASTILSRSTSRM